MKLITIAFGVLIISSFSCRNSSSIKIMPPMSDSVNSPKKRPLKTEKEVTERAKEFAKAYLKDPETFFKEVDNLMGRKITAEFDGDTKRWYVFFTNGFHHIHVYLDEDGNLGTLETSNGKFITRKPEPDISVNRESLPPLFSLSDFKKIANLPHNAE